MKDQEITRLLEDWADGEDGALEALIPKVVDELRIIARSFLAREHPHHSLQPTELINAVYVKLAGQKKLHWENRSQFFSFASQLMRRILVDHARRKKTDKRYGIKVPFDEGLGLAAEERRTEVLAVSEALDKLAELDERQAQVVEMRIFGGWTNEEIAEALGVGLSTVKRDWKTARAWLRRELSRK